MAAVAEAVTPLAVAWEAAADEEARPGPTDLHVSTLQNRVNGQQLRVEGAYGTPLIPQRGPLPPALAYPPLEPITLRPALPPPRPPLPPPAPW